VADDGRVDWLATPALDSPPAFAAILDPEKGGTLELAPTVPFETERCYVERSNVLTTTFKTADGAVRVTDSLNVGTAGRLPWGELARRVECLAGRVPMRWRVAPGDRFGTCRPWASCRRGQPVIRLGDQHVVVRAFDVGEPQVTGLRVEGSFDAEAGRPSGLLSFAYTDKEPVYLSLRDHIESRLDETVRSWRKWCGLIEYDGPWKEEVVRSALTLKLLIFSPTGAIAAAPTTSLPERIGGDRNYDYRYSWIRDSAFTIDALIRLGLHEEVHGALSWLLSTVEQTAPELHVFYGLDGRTASDLNELDLRGYRDSRPVRAGNSAETQRQFGNFGDLLEAIWYYVQGGNLLDETAGHTVRQLADQVCDVWQYEDSGIWELDQQRHYTVSKMGCWVALDRAVRLVEEGEVAARHVERWRQERDAVARWVNDRCWSEDRGAYTFYADGTALDASVTLAARNGFREVAGDRLLPTLRAIREELADGPLLYRYSGMRDQEGAFIACSFWLAEALAVAGRVEEGAELLEQMLGLSNDVGLYSEERDPSSGELLGNFPQGLSHLSLVNAATGIARARGGQRR
jgi:GH15 family glucan-1,4-alpha-glucosidase